MFVNIRLLYLLGLLTVSCRNAGFNLKYCVKLLQKMKIHSKHRNLQFIAEFNGKSQNKDVVSKV